MENFLNKLWGLNRLKIDPTSQKEANDEFAAIILSTNNFNLDRFLSLETFCKILENFGFRLDIYGIQLAQICVINQIKNLKISKSKVIQNLQILNKAKICENYEFIVEFLNNLKLIGIDTNLKKNKKTSDIFHKNLENYSLICDEILEICNNDILKTRLLEAKNLALNSSFKISVTGVINSGKSSMLNALINETILGTSNVPETANLSVIKFSKIPYAVVNFWEDCKDEKFIKISQNFDIKNNSLKIDSKDLKNFSGAKNEISEYVKFIELGINTKFLSQGVEIIDTPGLDDAIIKREILTKNFMQNADFTLHLMNVSQSTTKKDIEFITNTLLNSKIGGFAIVLTHCDLVSNEQIEEAINYTKKSIKLELQNLGFDYLEPKFFIIDSLSKRGISDIKEFLFDNFFGENSNKAKLIITNFKNEILLILDKIKKELNYKNQILNNDNILNLNNYKNIIQEIENYQNLFDNLNNKINETLQNFKNTNFSNSLKNGILNVKERVLNEVKYSKNHKKSLDFTKIKLITQKGFDDIFVDVFREFGQEIYKNQQNLKQNLALEFDFLKNFEKETNFDTKTFIKENLSEISYEKTFEILQKEIKNLKDITLFDQNLQNCFDNFVNEININSFFDKIIKSEFEKLQNTLDLQLSIQKEILQKRQKEIEKLLKNEKEKSENYQKEIDILKQKDEKLDEILQRLDK